MKRLFLIGLVFLVTVGFMTGCKKPVEGSIEWLVASQEEMEAIIVIGQIISVSTEFSETLGFMYQRATVWWPEAENVPEGTGEFVIFWHTQTTGEIEGFLGYVGDEIVVVGKHDPDRPRYILAYSVTL